MEKPSEFKRFFALFPTFQEEIRDFLLVLLEENQICNSALHLAGPPLLFHNHIAVNINLPLLVYGSVDVVNEVGDLPRSYD